MNLELGSFYILIADKLSPEEQTKLSLVVNRVFRVEGITYEMETQSRYTVCFAGSVHAGATLLNHPSVQSRCLLATSPEALPYITAEDACFILGLPSSVLDAKYAESAKMMLKYDQVKGCYAYPCASNSRITCSTCVSSLFVKVGVPSKRINFPLFRKVLERIVGNAGVDKDTIRDSLGNGMSIGYKVRISHKSVESALKDRPTELVGVLDGRYMVVDGSTFGYEYAVADYACSAPVAKLSEEAIKEEIKKGADGSIWGKPTSTTYRISATRISSRAARRMDFLKATPLDQETEDSSASEQEEAHEVW